MKKLTCMALALTFLASLAYARGDGADNIQRMRAQEALQSNTSAPDNGNVAIQPSAASGLATENPQVSDVYGDQIIQANQPNYRGGHK